MNLAREGQCARGVMAAALSAAPPPGGGDGGAACSDAQAHARELQGEDITKKGQIHRSLKDMMAALDTAKVKTIARRVVEIGKRAFPDGYLAAGYEALLKQHTLNLIHYAMPPDLRFDFDYETECDWDTTRGHILDIKLAQAALVVGVLADAGGDAGGPAGTIGGAVPPSGGGSPAPIVPGGPVERRREAARPPEAHTRGLPQAVETTRGLALPLRAWWRTAGPQAAH